MYSLGSEYSLSSMMPSPERIPWTQSIHLGYAGKGKGGKNTNKGPTRLREHLDALNMSEAEDMVEGKMCSKAKLKTHMLIACDLSHPHVGSKRQQIMQASSRS